MKLLIATLALAFSSSAFAKLSTAEMFEFCENLAGNASTIQEGRRTGVTPTPTSALALHKRVVDGMVSRGEIKAYDAKILTDRHIGLVAIVFEYDHFVSPDYVFKLLLNECIVSNRR